MFDGCVGLCCGVGGVFGEDGFLSFDVCFGECFYGDGVVCEGGVDDLF